MYCTETSIIDNWYGGEKTDYINFNVSSSKYIEGVFESCCWISTILNGPDNGWQVRVRLNLTKRLDKNVINTSPVALMEPIKTLSANCDHQFKIDIADIDGDIVKCRWSELAKKECIDATCGPVQGVTLDVNKCQLSVNLKKVGPYAILLQIEDYPTATSTTPLSSVPLQFIINATNSKCIPQNSTVAPSTSVIKFHESTRPLKDACIGLKPNDVFSENIVVNSSSKVTEIIIQGPTGIIKSDIKTYATNSSLYYMTLSWTPTQSQVGYHIFSLKAINQNGISTEPYSFKVVVGSGAPALYEPFPNFHVKKSDGYTFRLKSNIPIKNTNRSSSYIRIFEKITNLLVDRILSQNVNVVNQSLSFKSYFSFKVNTEYYVTIDVGLVSNFEYCGVESIAINSSTFWNFIVLNDFDGVLNYEHLSAFGYSNDSILIDLSSKNISHILSDTFSGMFQLNSLILSSNDLNSTSFLQLDNLNTLRVLKLNGNKITTINSNDLSSLKNLTELNLANNGLVSIDSNLSSIFTHLKFLYLNHNFLTQIDSRLFGNFSELKFLYLNSNKLREVGSSDFSNLVTLEYLNLESNHLIHFDRNSLLNIHNLKTVCLRKNPVVDLFPTSFKQICKTSPMCAPKIVDFCS